MSIDFYQNNAQDYFNDTATIDFSAVQNRFVQWLPKNGLILDAGCGSGRDTKAFLSQGFQVEAFDGSSKMAELATQHTGIEVSTMKFQDIDVTERYDGIYACASLLHVPRHELNDVLNSLFTALKPNGHLYASFKFGQGETTEEHRTFTNMNIFDIREICEDFPSASIKELWLAPDLLPNRKLTWLNVIFEKKWRTLGD